MTENFEKANVTVDIIRLCITLSMSKQMSKYFCTSFFLLFVFGNFRHDL